MSFFPEHFYDRQFRVWVCRVIDSDGFQVGDCDYEPTKKLARARAEAMAAELNG